VRNRLTAKTITSPDINEDATDWRQIAAELMVVDLISTVQPTGGGSPRNEWLLIDSDDAIGGKSPQHQGIVFDSQTRGDPEKHGYGLRATRSRALWR
jgi:hypothetical protein